MDTTAISLTAMELADQMGGLADTTRVRTVMIIAEIDTGTHTAFHSLCTDDRPWVTQAFLEEALARTAMTYEQAADE